MFLHVSEIFQKLLENIVTFYLRTTNFILCFYMYLILMFILHKV